MLVVSVEYIAVPFDHVTFFTAPACIYRWPPEIHNDDRELLAIF